MKRGSKKNRRNFSTYFLANDRFTRARLGVAILSTVHCRLSSPGIRRSFVGAKPQPRTIPRTSPLNCKLRSGSFASLSRESFVSVGPSRTKKPSRSFLLAVLFLGHVPSMSRAAPSLRPSGRRSSTQPLRRLQSPVFGEFWGRWLGFDVGFFNTH